MGKIFALAVFTNFLALGVLLGIVRKPITTRMVAAAFAWLLVFYVGMGLVLSLNTAFVRPK